MTPSLGASRVPLFPKDDPEQEHTPSNVRLPKWLWARLDKVAKEEGKSRNEVIEHFLRWAVDDYAMLKSRKK